MPQFVKAMQTIDYPDDKLQILFLICGHIRRGRRARSPAIEEGRADLCNHGPDLACVQAKLNFYNPQQNLLTRWFTAEYSLWFDLVLPGLQKVKLAIPLGGTSNHFPAQTLRALGGWDAFNVTEDCDLGLRLSWFRLNTVVVDSTTPDGSQQETFDHVILTMPFSVLRNLDYSHAGFTKLKQTDIIERGYGTNSKLQLQFDTRFWDSKGPWPGIANGAIFTDV